MKTKDYGIDWESMREEVNIAFKRIDSECNKFVSTYSKEARIYAFVDDYPPRITIIASFSNAGSRSHEIPLSVFGVLLGELINSLKLRSRVFRRHSPETGYVATIEYELKPYYNQKIETSNLS